MSGGTAFAVGLLIGLIIVLPVFIANRHKMARNVRLLLDKSATDDAASEAEVASSDKLSLGVTVFGCTSALITIGAGILLGESLVLIGGAVLLISVVLTSILSRHLQLSSPSEKRQKQE